MTELLNYDLKVAALIAVFYMFYRLLLSHETFHRVNRMVLLLTAVASFVLPLCVLTFHETVTVETPLASSNVAPLAPSPGDASDGFPWMVALGVVLIIGAVFMLGTGFIEAQEDAEER